MDLSTTYMGLKLKNPIVPSASPLSEKVENIRKMEDAGAAAVVMFSVFEEQVRHEIEALEHHLTAGSESFAEALSYFPPIGEYRTGTDAYLEIIREASAAVDIPIIGSLNGISKSGWVDFAKDIEKAGARGIELNVYHIPTDPAQTGGEIERMYVDIVRAVKNAVKVPVAVKLSPFFSATANMAKQLEEAGADALVLFNRFYQPDVDIENRSVASTLALSTPDEVRLPLRWIAILHGRIQTSLGASTGVHSANEVIKYLMAGADAVMTTSALLKRGIGFISTLVSDLQNWMETREFESVRIMKGSLSQKAVSHPGAFERANYIKILEKYKSEYSL
ncbi:MAG: dihydroorotate dehydrogenase-like protein [Kiritimatiellae bacterium]|nr:dihydroorotate dehydrogenase-like protein [Kiritimatiellia bacterium]